MKLKQLKGMMEVYMDMAKEEDGISFSEEGFAQIYNEVNEGLDLAEVKGMRIGIAASGAGIALTLIAAGYIVYKSQEDI